MPGLVPGIHVLLVSYCKQGVDGRDKPGHDGGEIVPRLDYAAFRFAWMSLRLIRLSAI
jgi:hypothetical protein